MPHTHDHRRDDTLTILTGSKIFGAVNFGRGSDTLDFSGFVGNTVLDVPGLNLLVPGMRNYVWDRPDDKIAIFDSPGSATRPSARPTAILLGPSPI